MFSNFYTTAAEAISGHSAHFLPRYAAESVENAESGRSLSFFRKTTDIFAPLCYNTFKLQEVLVMNFLEAKKSFDAGKHGRTQITSRRKKKCAGIMTM